MEKLEGQWFKGNVFSMSLTEFQKIKKYSKNVKKPAALRTKIINGKEYSQYYFKPIESGELD